MLLSLLVLRAVLGVGVLSTGWRLGRWGLGIGGLALVLTIVCLAHRRRADVYARMHAATKASNLGIALVGLATAAALDAGRAKTLIAVVFIFVTAPSAAHFVGRAAYRAEGIAINLASRDDLAELDEALGDETA